MTPKAADDLENIFQYISEELFAISSAAKLRYRLYIIMILPEFIFTREKIIKVVIYHL